MEDSRTSAGNSRGSRGWFAARVTLTALLALAAGLYSGAYLFGDALAHHSLPRLATELGLAHFAAGVGLGALGGRWWGTALIATWGSVLVAGLEWMDGLDPMAVIASAMPLLLGAGAWLGGRLARS